jgi:ActR/RegA family two-component response regulator
MSVVIVSDKVEFREHIDRYLTERGYEVRIPPHRQDVLEMTKQDNTKVVVLDLYVSQPSGIELLRTLRDQGYRGKVIILAGQSMRTVIPQAYSLGVHEVVGGPEFVSRHAVDLVGCAVERALGQQYAK